MSFLIVGFLNNAARLLLRLATPQTVVWKLVWGCDVGLFASVVFYFNRKSLSLKPACWWACSKQKTVCKGQDLIEETGQAD